MKRSEKIKFVENLHEQLKGTENILFVNYYKADVPFLQGVRKTLRADGAVLKIAKAKLLLRALAGCEGRDALGDLCHEQIGVVFAPENPFSVAKCLVNASQGETARLKVVGAFFNDRILSVAQVEQLAALPSKEVVYAQLAGVLIAPIATLARTLMAVVDQSKGQQA